MKRLKWSRNLAKFLVVVSLVLNLTDSTLTTIILYLYPNRFREVGLTGKFFLSINTWFLAPTVTFAATAITMYVCFKLQKHPLAKVLLMGWPTIFIVALCTTIIRFVSVA